MPKFEYLNSLNKLVTRYQNHVGGYDKAKWEQTVEQRILHGINHIPTKTAKLQSELIDLDLVRGSSFSKAKPKHGLFTVTWNALLRFFFLPLFYKWWSTQTSARLFVVFLSLYCLQILNVCLFVHNPVHHAGGNSAGSTSEGNVTQPDPSNNATSSSLRPGSIIQTSEILSPIVLMIVLTILHSQIVATHSVNYNGHHHNRFSEECGRRSSISGFTGKLRNKRRNSRFRRRSSIGTGVKGNYLSNSAAGSCTNSNLNLRADCTNGVSTNCKPESESIQHGSKKVFFEDESKSWTSSNSDKDEGIAEEIITEHPESCQEHDPFMNVALEIDTANVDNIIMQNNIASTLQHFVKLDEDDIRISKLNAENRNSEDVGHPLLSTAPTAAERRSNLRKRNVSKLSEASTTSLSCGECSSNNNDSSSEEDIRAETMEDEEIRSKSEWTAVTTNSEDDDYEENMNVNSEDDEEPNHISDHPFAWEFQKHAPKEVSPSCASSDKVSCTIWEATEAKKANLTVLDISSMIIAKVECARENSDYLYIGIVLSCIVSSLPCLWRFNPGVDLDDFEFSKIGIYSTEIINSCLGSDGKSRFMIIISTVEKMCLALFVFFLLAVAEKTYKQRFLYSKLFSRLTSSRKARKSGIPHFRLNKVRNIKTWLSIRSYLQRRGPQRSVDTIVSATFIAALILIFFLSVELLKDSNRMNYLYNVEVIIWSLCLGIYLMRFMTLGSRISQKYRNLSVIITEQLNLYLKMEQKPHKKEELLVANNVLKLAAELLKELEDPFKISSFASNPYLYNVTRLVILSAFSGVLSEMLGFKLKLYKIKIK